MPSEEDWAMATDNMYKKIWCSSVMWFFKLCELHHNTSHPNCVQINKAMVHHILCPTTLAWRTLLVLAPAIVEDRTQPIPCSKGVRMYVTLKLGCCSGVILPPAFRVHYQKYITYYNAGRGELSHSHRQYAQKIWSTSDVWFLRYADRQTDKQTNRQAGRRLVLHAPLSNFRALPFWN